MVKRYSFPTEEIAQELMLTLENKEIQYDDEGVKVDVQFINPTVTPYTYAIVCLGFQDEYNEDGELTKEGTTYDLDIFWKGEQLEAFNEYEVTPSTPNHNFS
jgi:hypothetical protein